MKEINKKGFGIVELVITISIMCFATSIAVVNIHGTGKFINNMQCKFCNNAILNLINKSKQYCKYNQIPGTIDFSQERNTVNFYCNREKIYDFRFPDKFNIYSINSITGHISIGLSGETSDACTITYKDRKEEMHHITMCVGTSHVQIQE